MVCAQYYGQTERLSVGVADVAPGIGPDTVEDTRPDGKKEAVHSFGWYMARYVADAKAKGAVAA